ncbi:hypothetical protein J7384_17975 [Endozoicomonas sp. G2_1]|nr:hypothetical protein [Endozoicomonas sp. G2_1]MBO9492251.1 hypothetical protein [Endozoicomonas sp. G2_1]MBO9492255.1 hypothetical protein [Endozoicomonas sp. G2_1]
MSDDIITGFIVGLCAFPVLKFIISAMFEKATREIEQSFGEAAEYKDQD